MDFRFERYHHLSAVQNNKIKRKFKLYLLYLEINISEFRLILLDHITFDLTCKCQRWARKLRCCFKLDSEKESVIIKFIFCPFHRNRYEDETLTLLPSLIPLDLTANIDYHFQMNEKWPANINTHFQTTSMTFHKGRSKVINSLLFDITTCLNSYLSC